MDIKDLKNITIKDIFKLTIEDLEEKTPVVSTTDDNSKTNFLE